MRVVHLSTSDCAGGAARAAFRLHKGLLAVGIDSAMLVEKKVSSLNSVQELRTDPVTTQFWNWLQQWYVDSNRTPVSNTFFSFGYPGTDVTQHPLVQQADVIHLHWTTGFQSVVTIQELQTLGKPICWSFHDQRAFTGGCHYSAGCTKFQLDCSGCPQLANDPVDLTRIQLGDARKLLDPSRVTIVALSNWIGDCTRASSLLRTARVETVPNSLEIDIFEPQDRAMARKEFNVPQDAFCFLFGADVIAEKRKGFHELAEAVRLCGEDKEFALLARQNKICLLCFGRPDKSLETLGVLVQFCGYIQSDDQMARVYSAADIFVLPSLEDNLPNTMLEAMSCGTPVMGFNIGGIPDVVAHGVTGVIVSTVGANLLAQAMLDVVKNPAKLAAMGKECRAKIERQFTLNHQATRCAGVYEDLLKNKPGVIRANSAPPPQFGPEFAKVLPRILAFAVERFTSEQPAWESNENAKTIGETESRRLSEIVAKFDPAQFQSWSTLLVAELELIVAARKRHRKRLSSRIKKLLHS